eukprot:TRINITY_DN100338_c0_g1_i2.p4 TRINITY_DN100338_c0_g1~~TRINITY_DN100338_c0_g1_i2.p4  ORF type:complete len:132 (-),score=26.18 TRINITY_DN100338_c0_g1_i2:334-729(-)
MLKNVAEGFGCRAVVDWMQKKRPHYPPTVNHPKAFSFVEKVAQKLLSGSNETFYSDIETTMAGEDFAFFGQKVPSCMIFLGMRNESAGSVSALHTPTFIVDENVMPYGAALHASLAMQFFESAVVSNKEEL